MMDSGTYNNVRQGSNPLSPTSPQTPGASSYKTNVNRTKTKKWVEAKVQSYDGDDWGNEYEDEYDEPEPEPAPRPMALRQTNQQTPSSRTFSQPAHYPEAQTSASGFRSPSGPPSLHVQTQSGASLPSLRGGPEQAVTSASSAQPGPFSDRPEYSQMSPPASQRHMSPAPQSAGPTSTRFPPRKSSMGQQDAPIYGDLTTLRSGSRPGSSSGNRPWMDQRSASPGQSTGSGGKSPPFIRPADIYKRMEEEKEKERMSMESGRPSMDSIFGRGEGTSSPANAMRSPTEQRRRTSFDSHDGSDSTRGLKPTLAPVVERKSEYGMEGLLAKAQAGDPESLPGTVEGPSTAQPHYSVASPEPAADIKTDTPGARAQSTSPKLPLVARMSGFGDDFFSTSPNHGNAAEPTSTAPAVSNESNKPASTATDTQPSSLLEGPKLQSTPDVIAPPSSEQQEGPKASTARHPQRPSIPGGWVSETPTIGLNSDQPTPMERLAGPGATPLANVENAKVSPVSESDPGPDDAEPTTEVKRLPSPPNMPMSTPEIQASHDVSGPAFEGAAGKHDGAVASEVVAAGPGQHPTPALPPLKTQDPLAPSSSQSLVASGTGSPIKNSPVQSPPVIQPSQKATGSSYTPTAPLNTRRSGINQAEIVIPTVQERKSTLSTVGTASPEKESDKLREEIIKSLNVSPATPSASGLLQRVESGSDAAPGPLTRESTYMSSIYDAYYSPEDKSLQETGQAIRQESRMAPDPNTTSGPTSQAAQPGQSTVPEIAPLSTSKGPSPEPAHRQRRFSWENGPEQVTFSPTDADPASSTFPSGSPADHVDNTSTASPLKVDVAPPPDALQTQPEAPGTISHRVSQVSSRAPDEGGLTTIDPPSPISFMADKSPKTASAGPRTSQLSLAEEKEQGLIDDASKSSNEGHPALVGDAGPSVTIPDATVAPEADVKPSSRAQPLSFREILNIGSTERRIEKMAETREQFFAMDSGLSNWLQHLQGQLVQDETGQASGAQTSPTGVSPSTQQPYYQQYLHASSTGLPGSSGRASIGNAAQVGAGQPASGFGSSGSNQVGAKSKELLQAAGAFGNKGVKSGMKLFNKGRSKLKERTGDKVFFSSS